VADKAKVRVLPKNEFDDKGNIKPLKPDPKDPDRRLGGVKGSREDLRENVWVLARLSRNRKGTVYVANLVIVLGEEEESPGGRR
jgi:hypothetical protein